MKKHLLFLLFAFTMPFILFAQSNEAIRKLNDAGVTIEQIEHCLKEADASYYFKSTNTSVSKNEDGSSYTSVSISEFDPRKPVGEQWTLVSTDGVPATAAENKTFNRTTNSTGEFNGKVDQASVKVISEDDKHLVIGLRFLEKSLPKKLHFYADCEATYTIDKDSKKLVSGTIVNLKETKVSVATLSNIKVDLEFILLDEAEGYHISNEIMDMTVRVLGQTSQSIATIVYSDFKKVK
ncbi:hypothetical protein [Algoriphagus sp.]|uniref:hypothetical protein n=1 Tax=Algoriphagus sp. TaxID=1872435 RepID=UPI0025DCBCFD|nr:hypothetical protein [Algoriphagus sp.]